LSSIKYITTVQKINKISKPKAVRGREGNGEKCVERGGGRGQLYRRVVGGESGLPSPPRRIYEGGEGRGDGPVEGRERMCEEEAVRYLRDLCGEKEALERASSEPQPIATKLVAQGDIAARIHLWSDPDL